MAARHVAETYDEILGHLDWPMVVVTARADDGERAGCLVGFHSQCSIEPRRHLVMVSVANHTWSVVQRATSVAVHVLGPDQGDLARAFGELTDDDADDADADGRDKWADATLESRAGPPILADAAAWFAGPIVERFEVGDHLALVVEPDRAERRSDATGVDQFGYQQAKGFRPGHPS